MTNAAAAGTWGGLSVDTSMGFTPVEGLIMGTRSGDIDAGIIEFLMRSESCSIADIDNMLNHRSGLLGISEIRQPIVDRHGWRWTHSAIE
jgi:acetate kinase